MQEIHFYAVKVDGIIQSVTLSGWEATEILQSYVKCGYADECIVIEDWRGYPLLEEHDDQSLDLHAEGTRPSQEENYSLKKLKSLWGAVK